MSQIQHDNDIDNTSWIFVEVKVLQNHRNNLREALSEIASSSCTDISLSIFGVDWR